MESTNGCEDFPSEMKRPIRELHESLADMRQLLNKFNDNYLNIKSKANTPLLKAKLELTNAYVMNSLFWIYLTTKGVNPHQNGIKQEIIRLKGYMDRVKQIEDKQQSMKLDTNAANRFIRSALWEPNEDNITDKRKLSESKATIDSKPNTSTFHNSFIDRKPQNKKKKFK